MSEENNLITLPDGKQYRFEMPDVADMINTLPAVSNGFLHDVLTVLMPEPYEETPAEQVQRQRRWIRGVAVIARHCLPDLPEGVQLPWGITMQVYYMFQYGVSAQAKAPENIGFADGENDL